MSRLNTMYQDDEFLKNISDMMGKLDNKNETEIKQEIEQIGYKEFYRYYKEKDVYIKQLQQENKILKENAENNDKVVDKVNWENQLLKKENQQIKDNWNKLKECLKDVMNSSEADDKEFVETILDIMQELEQGDLIEK